VRSVDTRTQELLAATLMSLRITDLCVNCDVCEPVCPNKAISMGPSIYEIAFDRCTECVGHHPEPQCVQVCPVECIELDDSAPESQSQLLDKYHRLKAAGIAE
jgi:ferredoxin